MRNSVWITAIIISLGMLAGCESDNSKQNLTSGFQALDAQQYEEAIARADQQLTESPTGAGAASALYLKGRALESKTAPSQPESRANLQQARDCYQQALQQQPDRKLEALIHAGIGNTSYWLDDYATAVSEWSAAYPNFDDPAIKSFMLYRIGLSQQRTGQFAMADQTFANVQQQFPGSDAANRAREHQGYKSFSVQLATFNNPSSADAEIGKLQRQGVMPSKARDARGNTMVSVGPFPSYSQAMGMKLKFASTYPQAIILP
jgi:tetratricopeptide (TPR) repeat protein